MIMIIDQLVTAPIDWMQTGKEKWILHAELDGRRIMLRFNDFPDENICTVFLDNEKHELEEIPKCWTLPAYRAK
jgi:hypothetical protein